jgi:hypothetical protein
MFICCDCCVLSGRGLCDELVTRPEEPYRLWCVVVCDIENLKNEAMTRVGSQPKKKLFAASPPPPSFRAFSHTIPILIFVLSRTVSFPSFHSGSRIRVFILTRWFPPLFVILHPFLSPYHFYVWTLLLLPHLCKYMSPRSMLDTFNFPYNKLHPLAEGSNM